MKRYICNYVIFNSSLHTNSVLCMDCGSCSVHRFEVETAATLYVDGAIVVAQPSAQPAIEAALVAASSLSEAIAAMLPLTASGSPDSDKVILQVTFSPKIVRKL